MSDAFKNINCPICKSENHKIIYKNILHTCNVLELLKITNPPASNIHNCKECNHSYLSPILKEEQLSRYYNEINSEYYGSSKIVYDKREEDNQYYVNNILKRIKKGKILEIGCGNGFLLSYLRDKGFDTYGIEPSPTASKYASNVLGLNVINDFLDENTYPEDYFDMIILMDVLEHLANPNELIQLIHRKLKKGRYVYCLTGNIESKYSKWVNNKWWYLSSWEHISFFSESSVKYLFEKNQFENITIQKTGHFHQKLINIKAIVKTFLKMTINKFIPNKFKYYGLAFDHFLIFAQKK